MKSTLDKLDGLSRKLSIQVPADQVRDAFEKVYKGIQRNATIKGFRQGKAPLTTIRSLYRDRVQQDVIQDLISGSYQKALEEHNLDPVGFPKVSFEQFSEDSDFSFAAEVEIRPEIQLRKYEGLKVEKRSSRSQTRISTMFCKTCANRKLNMFLSLKIGAPFLVTLPKSTSKVSWTANLCPKEKLTVTIWSWVVAVRFPALKTVLSA